MAKPYLGLSQRTANGRFLYGRGRDYRLASTMLGYPNYKDDAGSRSPASGEATTTVTLSVAASTALAITMVGNRASWTAESSVTGGGKGVIPRQGGYALQSTAYARVNGSSSVTATQKFDPGDGSALTGTVAFGANTTHDYTAAGTYTIVLQTKDVLNNTSYETVGTVTITAAVAPTFDVAPSATAIFSEELQIDASMNEAGGSIYCVAVPNGDPAPSAAQVVAGTDSSDVAAPNGSIAAPLAATTYTVTITGLTASTDYDVYSAGVDAHLNVMSDANVVAGKVDQATVALPVWGVNPTAATINATDVTFDGTPTLLGTPATGTVYVVVVPNGDPAPSVAEVIAGTASGGGAAVGSSSGACAHGVAIGDPEATVTGLTTATTYDAYLVLSDDGDGGNSAAVFNVNFTTI